MCDRFASRMFVVQIRLVVYGRQCIKSCLQRSGLKADTLTVSSCFMMYVSLERALKKSDQTNVISEMKLAAERAALNSLVRFTQYICLMVMWKISPTAVTVRVYVSSLIKCVRGRSGPNDELALATGKCIMRVQKRSIRSLRFLDEKRYKNKIFNARTSLISGLSMSSADHHDSSSKRCVPRRTAYTEADVL